MMQLKVLSTLLLVTIFFTQLNAQNANNDLSPVERFADYTPEEILALSDEERRSQVPMIYIWSANAHATPFASLIYENALSLLMYPAINNLDAAIRMFQKDLGDMQTGNLTVSQISELTKRASFVNFPDIIFDARLSDYYSDSFATVTGTMAMDDEDIAYPINKSTIVCRRAEAECVLSQSYVDIPSEEDLTSSIAFREFDDKRYTITRWTSQLILARPTSYELDCRVIEINLNFNTKEFYEIQNNGARDCVVLGETIPRLTRPRVTRFVDGDEVFRAELNELTELANSYISSDFTRRILQLIETESDSSN